MRAVYLPKDAVEATEAARWLEARGLFVEVRYDRPLLDPADEEKIYRAGYLSAEERVNFVSLWRGAPGEMGASIRVRDEDVDRAESLLEEFERVQREESRRAFAEADAQQTPWQCPNCGETLEAQFGACWRCGTVRPGGS